LACRHHAERTLHELALQYGIASKEVLLERNGLIQKGRFFYAKKRFYLVILTVPMNVAFRDGKPSANPADRTELFETASKRFFDSFKLTK